jgi:CheY-like chemotaxis protein
MRGSRDDHDHSSDVDAAISRDEESTMKILIVDGDAMVSLGLRAIIEDAGHEVVGTAMNRNEALDLADLADAAFVGCRYSDGFTGPAMAQTLADVYGLAVFYVTGNPDLVADDLGSVLGVIGKPYADGSIHEALEFIEDYRDHSVGRMSAVA